jgi:phytoene synthase
MGKARTGRWSGDSQVEGVFAVIAESVESDGNISKAQSYVACEAISRRAASSFYPMFRLLPPPQRQAMCAIYAFLRIADDISDQQAPENEKRRQLAQWREGLEHALQGDYRHAIYPALNDTITRYHIPAKYLAAALDGVEMDLRPAVYTTFDELQKYCYHVASVVGLTCIHIWGFTGEKAEECAINAGIAFQLTNVLRDLAEDAVRGRVYLPQEDLQRFSYGADRLRRGERDNAFRALMRFEVARARDYYDAAWPLAPMLHRPGRQVFLAMARTYRALLGAIEQRDYDVFSSRVRVSKWQRLIIALRTLSGR